jgi:hypothetical protein
VAVEESELDQRVSDWLEHRIEIERDKKDKSHGKLQDPAVELEQKAHRCQSPPGGKTNNQATRIDT